MESHVPTWLFWTVIILACFGFVGLLFGFRYLLFKPSIKACVRLHGEYDNYQAQVIIERGEDGFAVLKAPKLNKDRIISIIENDSDSLMLGAPPWRKVADALFEDRQISMLGAIYSKPNLIKK